MTIRLFRRGAVLISAIVAGSLFLAGPASACSVYSKFDDGGMEATLDIDYGDDVAIKRLDGGTLNIDLPGSSTATLEIYAQAYDCPGSYSHTLSVNGAVVGTFNPCHIWPTIWPGWGSISFDAVHVRTGMNSFQIRDAHTDWTTSNVYFGIDSNSFYGRSTMYANGVAQTGELMWRLRSTATVC